MTAPLAALLAAAWTLIAVVGVWSYVGLYRLDRRPRRGVQSQGKSAAPSCGAAGPSMSPERHDRAPSGEPGTGGST